MLCDRSSDFLNSDTPGDINLATNKLEVKRRVRITASRLEDIMDTSGVHTWLVLWKAYDACHNQAERSIEALGMCYSDFAVMECLFHRGPQTINAIGTKVSLTSGSITTAVDRLERRDFVERQSSAEDRRAKVVSLTNEGRKVIQDAFDKHQVDMEKMAAPLSVSERQTLLKLLKKLGKSAASSD